MSNLIEIRGDGALEIVKFERPNSTNVDDANWLASRLKVTLKHFSCEVGLSLTTYDIAQLQSELESCLGRL